MPMLMGSEMALKAIEMKKIAVFDGVCYAPLLSLHSIPPIIITGTVVDVVVVVDL
jgi:hypothetical protein